MGQGDESWTVWLDEHGAALVLLARHWVSTHADAEDVVQEAFVRFWRSRASVQEPVAYLYACVKHCALDWQRGRQRRQQRELVAARPESEPLFVAAVELDERRAAIESAGISGDYVLGIGDPAEAIVELAEERSADLIVVGTREPGLVQRVLGHSVSGTVAREASCDVLVVH